MSARKPTPRLTSAKSKTRQNQSILSFFGKDAAAAAQAKEDRTLFFDDKSGNITPFWTEEEFVQASANDLEFGDRSSPAKRRKTSDTRIELITSIEEAGSCNAPTSRSGSPAPNHPAPEESSSAPTKRNRGGFIDDSSDDDDDDDDRKPVDTTTSQEIGETFEQHPVVAAEIAKKDDRPELLRECSAPGDGDDDVDLGEDFIARDEDVDNIEDNYEPPPLTRESTSMYPNDFEGMDDFENDEFFEGGEEYMERKWMREQEELELGLDEDSKSESAEDAVPTPQSETQADDPICPICNANLRKLSDGNRSEHVNACLDGKPIPLPSSQSIKKEPETFTQASAPRKFQRAAVARPGQTNPYSMSGGGQAGSAFSKLMSGHAEDTAWAEAAANEYSSRGKPAYQRTCPFYKIMPGLFVAVDAFRYGKVEGQNAYFLSHFHSDHYIGLTSSWCHGPIYASKVSCNLMRQQLRVDPKWLVPLEFEKKVEVPNTKGVFVTMIPANHCPGSSLFLFEKEIGKDKAGRPRLNRILHCGDFRACPAHVKHPLLKPDVLDAISGLTRQQVIDTCYLDTTYLTPKYAFPSQEDVITACAQMCVSLSKEIVDAGDDWEKVKKERAGSAMTRFLEKPDENLVIKSEDDTKPRKRGRLLVVCGTYSIGKERICVGIAKALGSKIFAPPGKMKICAALEDPELSALMTLHPLEAQVHMQMLMEIRAETLHDYMTGFGSHFSRVVGFRPTGWNYRPPASRNSENPAVQTVLSSEGWRSRFSMRDLAPQRGSTRESNCFGVPYSEHSSFRELTMFCCSLRISRVIPTVNVGSAKSREKMKGWIERWDQEKKKNGLFKHEEGQW